MSKKNKIEEDRERGEEETKMKREKKEEVKKNHLSTHWSLIFE